MGPHGAFVVSDCLLTVLTDLLKRRNAPMPFDQFMAQALYHPEFGYYVGPRERFGREGDFFTAPEMTSLIGELLTMQWIQVWEAMGAPDPWQVIEIGPGRGQLAVDILRTARRFPAFEQAMTYGMVEISPDLRTRQQETLRANRIDPGRVRHFDHLAAAAGESGVQGIIFANELLDALPVHRLIRQNDQWLELGVGLGDERLVTRTLPAPEWAITHLAGVASRTATIWEEGQEVEIGRDAARWIQDAGNALKQGLLLLIDYGYPEKEFHLPARHHGTLTGLRRHQVVPDPLVDPGEVDLTAHVDFSAMARAGEAADLNLLGYTTQGWFLLGLGLLERVAPLLAVEDDISCAPSEARLDATLRKKIRQTVLRLTMPEEMGEIFKVLALGKGLPHELDLAGFRMNDQRHRL